MALGRGRRKKERAGSGVGWGCDGSGNDSSPILAAQASGSWWVGTSQEAQSGLCENKQRCLCALPQRSERRKQPTGLIGSL